MPGGDLAHGNREVSPVQVVAAVSRRPRSESLVSTRAGSQSSMMNDRRVRGIRTGERDERSAEPHAGERGHEEVDGVGEMQCNAVLVVHPESSESPGKVDHRVLELGEAQLARVASLAAGAAGCVRARSRMSSRTSISICIVTARTRRAAGRVEPGRVPPGTVARDPRGPRFAFRGDPVVESGSSIEFIEVTRGASCRRCEEGVNLDSAGVGPLAGVAVATLVAGLSQVAGVASAGRAAPRIVLSAADLSVGAPAVVPFGARRLGPAPASSALRLDVVLRPRDPAALTRFATAVSTPGTAEYRHFLPRGRFASVFGPTHATIDKVLALLRSEGFRTGAISSNHLVIPVTSTVAVAERGLHTALDRYRMPTGRIATANVGAPKLPASIAGAVQAVIGLDTLVLPQPGGPVPAPAHPSPLHVTAKATGGGPVACAAAASAARQQGSWTENQLAKAYSLNGLYQRGDLGNGVTIALFELTTYSASDIAGFQACYRTKTSIKNIAVKGGTNSNAGEGEAELDIEVVLGLAPKAHLLVYEAANGGTGTIDEYTAIVDQDRAQVMSSSWGVCEAFLGSQAAAAENTVFEQAAAQGQSMISIPGDEGSEGCLPNDFSPDGTIIKKGAGTSDVAVDPSDHTAYLTNSGNGTVSVMDEISLEPVATYSFGASSDPFDVAVDPVTHDVFVTLNGDNELAEIERSKLQRGAGAPLLPGRKAAQPPVRLSSPRGWLSIPRRRRSTWRLRASSRSPSSPRPA